VTAHRKAPPPPFTDVPDGYCQGCGGAVEAPRPGTGKNGVPAELVHPNRRRWHRGEPWEATNCLLLYKVTVFPRMAAVLLVERDGPNCACCGHPLSGLAGYAPHARRGTVGRWSPGRPWEVDHRIPLIDGGAFTIDNLQLLCNVCHRVKTAREAASRAGARRAAAGAPAAPPVAQASLLVGLGLSGPRDAPGSPLDPD
jgi:hypothetical protein